MAPEVNVGAEEALIDRALQAWRQELRRLATFGQLAAILSKTQSNIWRKLQCLVDHRLVRLVRTGKKVRPELRDGRSQQDSCY